MPLPLKAAVTTLCIRSSVLAVCVALRVLLLQQALANDVKLSWYENYEGDSGVWTLLPPAGGLADNNTINISPVEINYKSTVSARSGKYGLQVKVSQPKSEPWHVQYRVRSWAHHY